MSDLAVYEPSLWTGATAVYKYTPELEAQFTLETRFGDVYTLFQRDGEYIHLPRAVCPIGEDRRQHGSKIFATSKVGPRNPEQASMIGQAAKLFDLEQSFILRAGTGTGKTYMATQLICHVGKTTLVVVPKSDLIQQWKDAIVKFTSIPAERIGHIQQNTCDYIGKDVVIASLASVTIKDRYPPEVWEYFGLLIADETHRLGSEKFLELCNIVPALLRLGLSATPKRSDGKEEAIIAQIGPIRVQIDMIPMIPKVLRTTTTWKVPVFRYIKGGQVTYRKADHSPGKVAHITKTMSAHKERNAQIASMVKQMRDKGRKVIIFSGALAHIDNLIEACIALGIPKEEISKYVGALKKTDREAALKKFIIFTTWGMMAEGTDLPWMDAVIFGMPKSNIEQAAGRVLREFEGKKTPLIIDMIDDDSPVFASYAKTRLSYYRKVGAEVVDL